MVSSSAIDIWGRGRLTFIAAGLLLFLNAFASSQPCEARGNAQGGQFIVPEKYRFVFLIDTSGSMMGRGDGKAVIFPQVQMEIIRFLDTMPPNAEVIFVPFHQGPQDEARFRLPEQKEAAKTYVKGLQPTGHNTWIYRTLVYVLDRLPRDLKVATIYYMFTDGNDNDKAGPYRMRDVVNRFKLKQGNYDWIYYLALGVDVPKEVSDGLAALPRAKVQQSGVGEVPNIGAYVLKPATLQLGNLKDQPQAQVDLLAEAHGHPGPLRLQIEDTPIQSHGAFLTLRPQNLDPGSHTLSFELKGAQHLPDGKYTVWLCPSPPPGSVVWPQAIKVEFAYHPPASYRLVALDVPKSITLLRGQETTVKYRLEGNEWATDPISINVDAPPALQLTANGQEFPITLSPGQTVEIHVGNQGLPSGKAVQPNLQVQLPQGAVLADSLPPFPNVVQPKTLLDWLSQFWWLILLLLLGLLLWLWTQFRSWGIAEFIPTEGGEPRSLPLRGGKPLLKELTGLPDVYIERTQSELRLSYPSQVDSDEVKAKSGSINLESGDAIAWDEQVDFFKGGCKVGTLTIKHPNGRGS